MAPYYPDNPEIRRKSQKVWVDRATNDVILRLHETDIVRVRPNGDVTLSTGGWATHKTIRSMNDALELFDMYVESTSRNPPSGDWIVYDTDGQIFPYQNNKVNYTTTIPGRGDDAYMRPKWLADAYEVPYTPTPRRAPAAAASAAQRAPAHVISGPPAQHLAPAAAAASAAHALTRAGRVAAPVAVRQPQPPAQYAAPGTGSWANIARSGLSPPTRPTLQAHHMTGPGAPPAAAAAATSPGSSLRALDVARSKLQQQDAAPKQPALPVAEQLQAHMQQLGIHDDELDDDSHTCVVCMEHPRNIVLVPCGHMALCKDCCNTIVIEQKKTCPMCCQPVEYHVEVE
ncbi:hypothetical protein OEZ86_001700 [Tetradesmus obliquus]|nr:hypothetical protein OEZ86_001700 [Tetradesmus obliquus]